MTTLIYADCPTCGIEAPLITVERDVPMYSVLEPEENEDLLEAIYGYVPDPGEERPPVVVTCPEGHSLEGAQVKSVTR